MGIQFLGCNDVSCFNSQGAGVNLKFEEMDFPLIHPDFVLADIKSDNLFFKTILTSRVSRIKANVKKVIPKFVLDFKSHYLKR